MAVGNEFHGVFNCPCEIRSYVGAKLWMSKGEQSVMDDIVW